MTDQSDGAFGSTGAGEALLALAERCEKAEGPDRELDALVNATCCIKTIPCDAYPSVEAWSSSALRHNWNVPRYTASLDAALSLVPETTDIVIGRDWCIRRFARITDGKDTWSAEAVTEALALCAAALRARAAIALATGAAA